MPRQKSIPPRGDAVKHQGYESRLNASKRKALIRQGLADPIRYELTVEQAAELLVL